MYIAFIVVLLFIAVYDSYKKKISNILILKIVAISLVYWSIIDNFAGLASSLLGLLLGIFFLFVPYVLGGIAAGDVKLMGAVGAALGPYGVIIAFLYSAIAGGIYALILMLSGRAGDFPRRLWKTMQTFYYTRQLIYDKPQKPEQQVKLCYGVAIAAGTILYIVLEMTGSKQLIQF